MKNLFLAPVISIAVVLMSAFAIAQTDQPSTSPPLSQPLVREGDFAVKLADSLRLGAAANETEAESALSAAGIAPRNGWIADYPVTPDIVGELQAAVADAADSGGLAMGKDEALNTFQDVINQYNLNVKMDTSGSYQGDTSGAEYPDSGVETNYYSEEGPPVVTYYAPPPDYAYLYTWVPYPFWWWNSWFPGFFVLVDFDVREHDHGHYRGHDHGHDHGNERSVSNHFRDQRTGNMVRIDPTNRFRGGTFPATGSSTWTGPSAQRGARAIVNTSRAPSGQAPGGATVRGIGGYGGSRSSVRAPSGQAPAGATVRGYGGSRSSVGTRSSAFDRSVNNRVERSSGNRGYQSRSNAGQIRGRGSVSGGSRGFGGGGGFRGGGHR